MTHDVNLNSFSREQRQIKLKLSKNQKFLNRYLIGMHLN